MIYDSQTLESTSFYKFLNAQSKLKWLKRFDVNLAVIGHDIALGSRYDLYRERSINAQKGIWLRNELLQVIPLAKNKKNEIITRYLDRV